MWHNLKILPTQHMESTVWAGGSAPHAHRHGQLGAQDVGVARLNAGKAACLGHQDIVAADFLGVGAIPGEDISLWCRSSFSLSLSIFLGVGGNLFLKNIFLLITETYNLINPYPPPHKTTITTSTIITTKKLSFITNVCSCPKLLKPHGLQIL